MQINSCRRLPVVRFACQPYAASSATTSELTTIGDRNRDRRMLGANASPAPLGPYSPIINSWSCQPITSVPRRRCQRITPQQSESPSLSSMVASAIQTTSQIYSTDQHQPTVRLDLPPVRFHFARLLRVSPPGMPPGLAGQPASLALAPSGESAAHPVVAGRAAAGSLRHTRGHAGNLTTGKPLVGETPNTPLA
ncbi:unnamed protein product [Protopolystoma xenopodis]|uniref:Uncharacterized protein n=1 Tax=Protopolystoma xenopodis TaxID=117903 RepID=A0A448WV64_9PLAT|nr:unnamed protein product [Protopolystoma xenopodis]